MADVASPTHPEAKTQAQQSASATPVDRLSRAHSFQSAHSTQSGHAASDTPMTSSKTTEAGDRQEEKEWAPPADGPLKTPIPKPSQASIRPPPPQLTPEQQSKYVSVLDTVSSWKTLPATSARNAPQEPLEDHERMWLTRECLLRYLRATKWHTPSAIKRLQSTLTWRREYGADTFTADYISPENETGKQVILGYDTLSRPCLYLIPANQNTKISDRQIHHLSYMLDRLVDMMPAGQESACLIVNFKGAAGGAIPTVNQARSVLNILQTHSPERLGRALINDLPWYVHGFFKLISPFIDPVTRDKMKFNEDRTNYIPAEQLWKAHGGELEFEYDHSVYWPALIEECQRRRAAYKERWVMAGSHIGEYEAYLRGGDQPSLQEVLDSAPKDKDEGEVEKAAEGVGKLSV